MIRKKFVSNVYFQINSKEEFDKLIEYLSSYGYSTNVTYAKLLKNKFVLSINNLPGSNGNINWASESYYKRHMVLRLDVSDWESVLNFAKQNQGDCPNAIAFYFLEDA